MTISATQFHYLNEMGIDLYVQRSTESRIIRQNTLQLPAEYTKHPLVTDLALSLGLSAGEINHHKDHLSLDTINWYFADNAPISLTDGQLVTPELDALTGNGALKKQLWQTLCAYLKM